jgi:hypothetical protein
MYNAGYAPHGYAPPYAMPGYPLARTTGWDIVGADPAPAPAPAAATPSFLDKTKAFLGEPNSLIGVKNGYILGGAVVLGVVWYGHAEGWFGR